VITRSVLDTEYLPYPVQFVIGGTAQNPTGDPVAFAFMPNPANQDPGSGDWHTGSWVTTGTGTYMAQVLVGPSNGGVALAVGLYNVWLRITDSPEIPVEQVDLLSIV
jgi:hypothetical protein